MRRSLLFFAIAWIAAFTYFALLADIVGPYMDDWATVYLVKAQDEGNLTIAMLFERFSGAHTPALARVLFGIEYFVFQATNIFPKLIAFIGILGSLLVFYRNIESSPLQHKQLLGILGIVLAFSPAQLYTFNYPWAGLQHPSAIFLSLLAIHLLVQDVHSGRTITARRSLGYLSLCGLAALFTAIGVFALLTVCTALFLSRAPARTLGASLLFTLATVALLWPDDIILRVGSSYNEALRVNEDLLQESGFTPNPFWPYYPAYLSAFTGAVFETVSLPLAIASGALCFALFSAVALKMLLTPSSRNLFFFLVLCMLLAYALTTSWGRYRVSDYQFDRYSAIYPWLLCSGCICVIHLLNRTGIVLCSIVLAGTVLTGGNYVNRQLSIQQLSEQADINMVNNSLVHMTYHKVAMPWKIFGFTPATFHDFQKNHQWGIYRKYRLPSSIQPSGDRCEAIKTKEFIVSEKKFVEYQLSAWNITSDEYLPRMYAIDPQGQIVAQGETIRRRLRWLPRSWMAREDLMMYLVVPRSHPLHTLRLVGGTPGNFCEVTLIKK